jgi:hypothetical protein
MKEVQDPMVNALKANSELINAVSKKICLRPPQLVANFTQPLQSHETLVLDLRGQYAEPR